MTAPVVCIVGPSDSGKTNLIVALVGVLTRQGYRVAAVKHAPHGFEADKPGTDSARFKAAGASPAGVVSAKGWALTGGEPGNDPPEEIAQRIGQDCDIVLAEGFRASAAPKIMIVPATPDPTWETPKGVIAVVSGTPVPDAPWHCRPDEVERLANFICDQFLKPGEGDTSVSLLVDGKPVRLGTYAASVFTKVMDGLVSTLRDVHGDNSDLRVEVRRRPRRS